MHMCICICVSRQWALIYAYMYVCGCICVSLCACSWMGSQRGDLISDIFEVTPEYPEDFSLSILTRRPHKELCPQKSVGPEEGRRTVISQE